MLSYFFSLYEPQKIYYSILCSKKKMIITITIMLHINYSAKYYYVDIEYSKYYRLSKCSGF